MAERKLRIRRDDDRIAIKIKDIQAILREVADTSSVENELLIQIVDHDADFGWNTDDLNDVDIAEVAPD